MPVAEVAPDASDPPDAPLDTDIRVGAADRRRLLHDLRHAVEQRGFVLHYQPSVALATGVVLGAEALPRWSHRRRGLIAPATFIPLAEQRGLGLPLGGWVLDAACRETASWPDGFRVSVNLSKGQLRGGALTGQLAQALERSALAPERLELELAESLLTNLDEDALLALAAVRDIGIGVTLDEFGGEYGSIATLRRLPLTAIKLDRSLVRDLPHEPADASIVRAVVSAAGALGLAVAAEGIETEAQRAFLAGVGVCQGQGTLLGRPGAATAFRQLAVG